MTEAEWLSHDAPVLRLSWDRGWPSPRKQRLLAVAVCRRLLRLLPDASRPRLERGLAVAELYADKKVKWADLKAAQARLPRLNYLISYRNWTYAKMLNQCAAEAVHWACGSGHLHFAGHAAMSTATTTAYSALPQDEVYIPPAESRHSRRWSAGEHREKRIQYSLTCDVCGDLSKPVVPRVGKASREIVQLARACYDERLLPSGELNSQRLAALADALDAADFAPAIRDHCREPDPHVRGCWAIDLLLGQK